MNVEGQFIRLAFRAARHEVAFVRDRIHKDYSDNIQFIFTVGGTAAIGGTGAPQIASSFSTLTPIQLVGHHNVSTSSANTL